MSRFIYKQVVGDSGFREVQPTQDAEHWITVHPNGKQHKGSPVLINGAGQIIGGAGGKLTGKFVKPTSKSKARPGTEQQNAPSIWLGPAQKQATKPAAAKPAAPPAQAPKAATTTTAPKPAATPTAKPAATTQPTTTTTTQPPQSGTHQGPSNTTMPTTQLSAQEAYEKKKAEWQQKSAEAFKQSESAKTKEEHIAAMNAHAEMHKKWKSWMNTKNANEHAKQYHVHKKEAARLAREEVKAKRKVEGVSHLEQFYSGKTPEQISTHLSGKYNLAFSNGVSSSIEKQLKELNWQFHYPKPGQPKLEGKEYLEKSEELRKQLSSDPTYRLKGVTPIDITTNTASAKAMRQMLGHLDRSLELLEATGFNIKDVLAKTKVQFVSATTGKHNGVAWQRGMNDEQSYFAVHPIKRGKEDIEQVAAAKARAEAGQARWSVSSASDDPARATIVHELAHAVGLNGKVNSPKRLQDILSRMFPGDLKGMREWIRSNISEYATSNIKETDAELAAMVTDPNYKRGTLPKELEAHVDWLFNRNGAGEVRNVPQQEKKQPPKPIDFTQTSASIRNTLKTANVKARVRVAPGGGVIQVFIPPNETFTREEQRTILETAKQAGLSFVRGLQIDPDQYLANKTEFNFYPNPQR